MAFKPATASQLRKVLKDIREAADELSSVCDFMDEKKMEVVHLHFTSFVGYAVQLKRFASQAKFHAENQFDCSQVGDTPQWIVNSRRAAHDKSVAAALAEADAMGIVKPEKPTKKAAGKKKG